MEHGFRSETILSVCIIASQYFAFFFFTHFSKQPESLLAFFELFSKWLHSVELLDIQWLRFFFPFQYVLPCEFLYLLLY